MAIMRTFTCPKCYEIYRESASNMDTTMYKLCATCKIKEYKQKRLEWMQSQQKGTLEDRIKRLESSMYELLNTPHKHQCSCNIRF